MGSNTETFNKAGLQVGIDWRVGKVQTSVRRERELRHLSHHEGYFLDA